MLLLMAKGYTITRGRLTQMSSVRLTVFFCLYVIVNITLFVWEGMVSVCHWHPDTVDSPCLCVSLSLSVCLSVSQFKKERKIIPSTSLWGIYSETCIHPLHSTFYLFHTPLQLLFLFFLLFFLNKSPETLKVLTIF